MTRENNLTAKIVRSTCVKMACIMSGILALHMNGITTEKRGGMTRNGQDLIPDVLYCLPPLSPTSSIC